MKTAPPPLKPGLIASGGPGVGAPYSMINAESSGRSDDSARTARMNADALSEDYREREWMPKNNVFQIRKPGEYQLVHGM